MNNTRHQDVQNRMPTGVPGLDEIMRGGLPRNYVYLIQGDPGSGKTTMSMQFLLDGARRGERTMLSAGLTRLGHEVETAVDGPSAVRLVLEQRPDVALIDIGLPGLSGHEVARRIRSETSNTIFLVALTGYGQPEDRQQALESGFDEHPTKPIDIRRLQKLIERRGKPAKAAGLGKAAGGS
jgi:CheY-like chemotaxis protein